MTERETEGAACGGTETILLAEDEEIVRTINERVLREAGYTVLTAVDGQEAVRVFEANADSISLVILDVVMPRMDGIVACHHIWKIREDVLFLFTSGYGADVLGTGFLEEAGHCFLGKPVRASDLLQKVREILGPGKLPMRTA
jgi:two-component system cell cycle sensor histidine kinase/response regulator CckA